MRSLPLMLFLLVMLMFYYINSHLGHMTHCHYSNSYLPDVVIPITALMLLWLLRDHMTYLKIAILFLQI